MSDAGTDSTEPVTKTSGSWREGVDMPLTIVAAGFLIVFVAVGVIFADPVRIGGAHIYAWIANNFGWLYALGTAFFVLFIAFMGFSKIGKVRLGPPGQHTRVPGVLLDRDDVRARLGIGLIAYGAAEPVMLYEQPPPGGPPARTPEGGSSACSTRSSTGRCTRGPSSSAPGWRGPGAIVVRSCTDS